MAAFVKENGWWPTLGVLRSFCRDLSVMLGQDRPVANLRRDAAALLAAEAVPLPAEDKPPKDAKHRAYKLPVGGIPGAPPIERERQWGEQACIDALRRWSDRFPRTERLTEARYRAFAKGRPAFTCAQRVRAVWRLHQTARAGTGGKRAQVNQRSITIRIAVKRPAKVSDISYMSYNDCMARDVDGFAVLAPERKRSRSKRQAEERLTEADRRLASVLSKSEIDSIADAAERAAAIVAAQARPGVSALSGEERPSPEDVAAASKRHLFRQFALRKQLLNDAITAAEVADLLGTTRQTPHDRYKAKTLLAIRDSGKLRFPMWQFDANGPDGVLDGLRDVLRALEAPMSELGRIAWFVSAKPQLQGRTPVEALRAGEIERVVGEARAVGAS